MQYHDNLKQFAQYLNEAYEDLLFFCRSLGLDDQQTQDILFQLTLPTVLRTCHATNMALYLQWAKTKLRDLIRRNPEFNPKYADREPAEIVYDFAVGIKKQPFRYFQNGDAIIVEVFDAKKRQFLWTFPSWWLQSALGLASERELLVRYKNNKPYLSYWQRYQLPSGKWQAEPAPVHRVFMNVSAKYDRVFCHDGNLLNYCGNNLYIENDNVLKEADYSGQGSTPYQKTTGVLAVQPLLDSEDYRHQDTCDAEYRERYVPYYERGKAKRDDKDN